jgi:hypothetical protein
MPELYHKYAGHDTNRDWFMLNLKETQLLTRMLYTEWWPTVSYDIHQMGTRGARLFVPPFYDPINPNLDPRINQWITLIGAHMAADLADAGKRGVLTHAMYDNWWNGGNRTTPQRHNIVAVLTEAASVRMASPIFLEKDELRGSTRGFSSHQPAINFVDPWPGGWWRLRDIVEYELISARSLLTLAAKYRTTLQTNDQAMAKDAIRRGQTEPPFAWVVPAEQRDPGTAARMVRILHQTGIEVHRAESPFQGAGQMFAAGSWILPAAQPYRAHLKDMMERQVYPSRLNAKGEPEPPYDVSGWTLPLQMGVQTVAVADEFPVTTRPLDQIELPRGKLKGASRPDYYVLDNRSNDDFIVLGRLLAAGVDCEAITDEARAEGTPHHLPAGALRFAANARSQKVLDEVLPTVSSQVRGAGKKLTVVVGPQGSQDLRYRMRAQRIGVYQPWMPSMDEGWTRLVLEQFQLPYATVHNAEIRAGELKKKYDAIMIPSIDVKTLREGYGPDQTEPAYVGGLGQEGTDALRAFVEAGGTLVCLENSSLFAIDGFGLPVKNALKDVPTSVFYAPGSIVRIVLDAGVNRTPVVLGVPSELSAYFDRSLAFDLERRSGAVVVASYAKIDVLQSGWLLGPEKIEGKAAIVEVPKGQGRVILFGFPPQHRGQTHATFRLLFNALLRGGMNQAYSEPGVAG